LLSHEKVSAEPTPAVTPAPSSTEPLAPTSREGRPTRALRLLFGPLLWLRRHPGRALALLGLTALLGLAVHLISRLCYEEYHLHAARQAVERGHNPAALTHLRVCRRMRPDDREVLILSARVARRSRSWSEAEATLDRYWELYGDEDALVLERLLLQAARGEVEAAGPLLRARIERDDPSSALAREALIAGLQYRFRLREAEREIEAWLSSDPDNTFALFALAKLQEEREQTSEALGTFRRLVEIDPEHDEARLRMAALLVQLNQGEEALPHLAYLRRRMPDDADVLVRTAQALDLQARADEARDTLDECLRLHPNNPRALAERGRIARRDGDGELAEEYLSRAVRLDPGDGEARHQYCLALSYNGKKAEAAKQQEALRQTEDDVRRINELLKGRLQESPDDPAGYFEAAMIALRAGLAREGLRWLLTALQVDPNHLPTHRTLAFYYQETGSPILAARHRAIAQRLSARAKTPR
jgi:tetratricopeptide (TPR) repeat protein